jgi:hypothetical protein
MASVKNTKKLPVNTHMSAHKFVFYMGPKNLRANIKRRYIDIIVLGTHWP